MRLYSSQKHWRIYLAHHSKLLPSFLRQASCAALYTGLLKRLSHETIYSPAREPGRKYLAHHSKLLPSCLRQAFCAALYTGLLKRLSHQTIVLPAEEIPRDLNFCPLVSDRLLVLPSLHRLIEETVSRDYNPARDPGGNTLLTTLNFCPLVLCRKSRPID